jgi:Dual-action HEIGH metallo-peptidase
LIFRVTPFGLTSHKKGNGIDAMTRYALILGVVSLLAALSAPAHAQSIPSAPTPRIAWTETPSIVVLSTNADSRIGALREAVDFWNSEFSMLGSPFRLGRIVHSLRTISDDDVRLFKANRLLTPTLVNGMREANGDVIVALCDDTDFNAFTSGGPIVGKILIAIPSFRKYWYMGIERNVIAHELGHAVGLGHNDDWATLMCGGATCRHPAFPSNGFLPLTSAEKARLFEMYPPSWESKPSRRWKADPIARSLG